MNDKMNKTSICSVVALDIIDYSKKTATERAEIKGQFDNLINLAVIDIPEADRIIVETAQGAVIACSGPLEDALEDALFISLTIRDEILKNNIQSLKPLYVQLGINLGSVVRVEGKKGQTDIIGEGVDEAKRIMSFANPNQILVSRVYYEMASKLTQEILKMFEQYDMHAHDQDIFAVRLLKDQAATKESANDSAPENWQLSSKKINWVYVVGSVLAFAGFFVLGKWILTPIEPTITMDPPVVIAPTIKPESKPTADSTKQAAEPAQTVESSQIAESGSANESGQPVKTTQEQPKKGKTLQKKPTQKTEVQAKTSPTKESASNTKESEIGNAEKPTANVADSHSASSTAAKPTESKTEKNTAREKSGWQTFKDSVTSGTERKCTQAEIAMNQCAK